MQLPWIEIYTDGACWPNPGGAGGWGYTIPSLGLEGFGGEDDTTNNRMELMGILMGLEAVEDKPVCIFTDSKLCVFVINRTWKAKKNLDLIKPIWELIDQRKARTHLKWIKGHNGHVHNERADELATKGRQTVVDKQYDEPRLSILMDERME